MPRLAYYLEFAISAICVLIIFVVAALAAMASLLWDWFELRVIHKGDTTARADDRWRMG